MVSAIIAVEIGFWVLLLSGLAIRYLARMRRLSALVLLGVPLLDVVLLSLIGYDILVNGVVADFSHGLGAIYLGFTIGFGHHIIKRTDAHFHHRFAGGPAPVPPPKAGWAKVRHEWVMWLRMLLAATVACMVLLILTLLANNPTQTAELSAWILRAGVITGVWLVGWPLWETVRQLVFPTRAQGVAQAPQSVLR